MKPIADAVPNADAAEPTQLVLFEGELDDVEGDNSRAISRAVASAASALGLVPPDKLSASEMLWYSLAFTDAKQDEGGWTCRTIPIPRPTDLSDLVASPPPFRPGHHYTGQIYLRLKHPKWRLSVGSDNLIIERKGGGRCDAEFGFHSLRRAPAPPQPLATAAAVDGECAADRFHRWVRAKASDSSAWVAEFREVFKLAD
jgi:hypothetical protein